MISIGDFARLGRVSVRMLRHYDALGLLRPQHVDPHSGYRFYTLAQLRRLNRIVALKDLGITLDLVATLVEDEVDAAVLRAVLTQRQAELQDQLREGHQRLDRVRARLRLIEGEDHVSRSDITTTIVAATVGHGLRARAASATSPDVGPVITALYPEILARLGAAGVTAVGPSTAYYTPADDEEDALWVHATFPVPVAEVAGLQRVELPGAEVASLIHRGSMAGVDDVYQALHQWVREHGFTASGAAREVYLEFADDPADWVTEVQLEFVR